VDEPVSGLFLSGSDCRHAGARRTGHEASARLCIMELFWDAQKFEAASFSLNATSLYFTCMANGNSRFYSVEKFYRYLESAGFSVEQRLDNLGVGHTLLICPNVNNRAA
jgi:hypothetical protein